MGGQNQVWRFEEEVHLFRVVLLHDTCNFLVLDGKIEGRTRKQVENKWQNIKRKTDAGILEWKTVFFAAIRHFFDMSSPQREVLRGPLLAALDNVTKYNVKQHSYLMRLDSQFTALRTPRDGPLTCRFENDSGTQPDPQPPQQELPEDQLQAFVDQIIHLINM